MTDDVEKCFIDRLSLIETNKTSYICKLLKQDIYLITFMDITNFYKHFVKYNYLKNKKLRPKQLNKVSK